VEIEPVVIIARAWGWGGIRVGTEERKKGRRGWWDFEKQWQGGGRNHCPRHELF
jgi:hypothetical protein